MQVRICIGDLKKRLRPEVYQANKDFLDREVFSQKKNLFVVIDERDLVLRGEK